MDIILPVKIIFAVEFIVPREAFVFQEFLTYTASYTTIVPDFI